MAQKKIDLAETVIGQWASAGFKEHLLPIIPYDAVMSGRTSVTADNRGKVPGLPVGDAWGGFPGWQNTVATDEHIEFWARLEKEKGAGVGIQTRQFPALDIDVTESAFSGTLAALADLVLGPAPERVGRAPKRLMAYALAPGAEPIRKHRVEFTLPETGETKHAIEVLGAGQQYIVAGIHPGTGNPYAWTGGRSPADIGAGALTPVTLDKIEEYLDEAVKAVGDFGGTVLSRSALAGEGAEPQVQAALRGNPDLIRAALAAAGNDFEYDGWIRMVAAIKAALGGDEAHYHVYEDWCLSYPGNTAQIARAKWDSVKPPYRVGANYIYEQAEARGWRGRVQAAFTPITVTDDVATDPNVPHYVREWVWAALQERFVRLSDRLMMTRSQFACYMASPNIGPSSKKNPNTLFFEHPRQRTVESVTYVPGGPDLLRVGAFDCVNLWMPSPKDAPARARAATVTDADVQLWLDHMALLIPDPVARKTVLDWMAYVIQNPQDKPNWAIFLGGAQGIGKDLALVPLIHAVGEDNTRQVQPSELTSEYTDWVSNKRLVVVQEMRNFETKTVMNKLKMYITRPPENVPVHQKYMSIYQTPNVAAFVFMSNFEDALSLEKGDRRYFVYWSPMKPQSSAYYNSLAAFTLGPGGDEVAAWLHARHITGFDAQGRAPGSAAKDQMMQNGLSEFEQTVFSMIEAGAVPFDAPVGTLNVLWDALPQDIRRLPGGGMRKLSSILKMAGGAVIEDATGEPRRIPLDAVTERKLHGRAHLWAIRDPDLFNALSDDMIRHLFRQSWVAGASPNDVFTPV
jgi:ribosomal protein S17E